MKTTGNESRSQVAQCLCHAFTEFVAFNLYHLNKEEMQINPLLLDNFTAQDIRVSIRALLKICLQKSPLSCLTGRWVG